MEKINYQELQLLEDNLDNETPEKQLLGAILLCAVRDAKAKKGVKAKQAETYFLQSDDHLLSFRSICSILELDQTKILKVVGIKSRK